MGFNENQARIINDFVMRYNSEEIFRNNAQMLYNNEIGKLSILNIYALEEILRFGNQGYFNMFLKTKGTNNIEQAVNLFDGFVELLNNDENFKKYKIDQLENQPETLSAIENFAFSLVDGIQNKKVQTDERRTQDLEYDPMNSILFSTDQQIRETLENLFFGEFIFEILELESMKEVKARQKEKGRIANIDKPIILQDIKATICFPNDIKKFEKIIDVRFVQVKMQVLLGQGIEAFSKYTQFNTNISADEILERKNNKTTAEIYNYFKELLNERRVNGTLSTEDAMNIINKIKRKK